MATIQGKRGTVSSPSSIGFTSIPQMQSGTSTTIHNTGCRKVTEIIKKDFIEDWKFKALFYVEIYLCDLKFWMQQTIAGHTECQIF